MIPIWEASALGAIQGLAEFLPISSSAHLRIVPWLLQWPPVPAGLEQAFDVSLHAGTLVAVLVFFFFDWLMIFASYIGDLRQKRWLGGRRGSLLPKIVIATVPGAVAGKLLESRIEEFFYSTDRFMWVIAATMALFGLLLLLAEKEGRQNQSVDDLSYRTAILIGAAQAFAIIPGVSRSGVTIFAALLLGLRRADAARFSFLLATPIIVGAVILKAKDLLHAGPEAVWPLVAGVTSAAVVGFLAIFVLLKYVQTRSYAIFVYYRWVIAAVILAVFFARMQ